MSVRKSYPSIFLLSALARYLPAYFEKILRRLFGKKIPDRNSAKVSKSYDALAERKLAFLNTRHSLTLSEYVFDNFMSYPDDQDGFRLIEDKIVWASQRKAEEAFVLEIERYLSPYLGKKGTIVEFGSGTGRNLLWLKSKYPQTKFIGLELSSKNVELAKSAAYRFGLEADFYVANVCETKIPPLPADILTVFSVHALEQMPRIYQIAVDHMMRVTSEKALFFEPVSELYPYNLRGFVSRMRPICLDRLRGLLGYLSKNYRLTLKKHIGVGVNPLNESCVLAAERRN